MVASKSATTCVCEVEKDGKKLGLPSVKGGKENTGGANLVVSPPKPEGGKLDVKKHTGVYGQNRTSAMQNEVKRTKPKKKSIF